MSARPNHGVTPDEVPVETVVSPWRYDEIPKFKANK